MTQAVEKHCGQPRVWMLRLLSAVLAGPWSSRRQISSPHCPGQVFAATLKSNSLHSPVCLQSDYPRISNGIHHNSLSKEIRKPIEHKCKHRIINSIAGPWRISHGNSQSPNQCCCVVLSLSFVFLHATQWHPLRSLYEIRIRSLCPMSGTVSSSRTASPSVEL